MARLERRCAQCGYVSKYCCPRCSTRSCSLACMRLHKKEMNCDGIRDKTAYIKVKDFTDINLLSDYRFLEEVARAADNASRNKLKRQGGRCWFLPPWLHRLQVEARIRGTNLKILPACFTKRKQNSSILAYRNKTIYWHVEWVFPDANVSYFDSRVSENSTFSSLLEKYLSPSVASPEIQHNLIFYHSAGYNGIKLLMKMENTAVNHPKYVELDISKSLKWNLRGKTIVEYPTVTVILKDHIHGYQLADTVDSDNEITEIEKNTEDCETGSEESSANSEENLQKAKVKESNSRINSTGAFQKTENKNVSLESDRLENIHSTS